MSMSLSLSGEPWILLPSQRRARSYHQTRARQILWLESTAKGSPQLRPSRRSQRRADWSRGLCRYRL